MKLTITVHILSNIFTNTPYIQHFRIGMKFPYIKTTKEKGENPRGE
jgi:hypothetical protein